MNETSKLKVVNHRAKGGLVLKRAELQTILEEEDAVGLVFGVEAPGQAFNVRLKVYKVIQGAEGLEGELRNVSFEMGAPKLGELGADVQRFCFEGEEMLKKCGFDFAYIRKDRFLQLFSNGEDEVFVAGNSTNFGTLLENTVGEWFTLTVTPRDISKERFFGNPPQTEFLQPCPPFWRPGSGGGAQIELKR